MAGENKKLSYKRFIPMLLIMLAGSLFFATGKTSSDIFRYCLVIFDCSFRSEIIYFAGSVIGFFHYWNITKDKQESVNVIINTSIGFIDSIGSAIGYAFIIDKGMNLGDGLLKEIFNIQQYFFKSEEVDYYSIGFVIGSVIFIGTFRLYKMAREAVFEIIHPFEYATPSQKAEDLESENTNSKS